MRCVPASSWKTMPEEMMGVIPSSISVPRLLAIIMRSQYKGSEVSMRHRLTLVHAVFSLLFDCHTRRHNAIQRHLAHDQEDDQGHTRPYYPLLERHFRLRDLHFGDERGERLHEIEEADCCGRELALLCVLSRLLNLRRTAAHCGGLSGAVLLPSGGIARLEPKGGMVEAKCGGKGGGKRERQRWRGLLECVLSGLKNTAVSKRKSALADVPA